MMELMEVVRRWMWIFFRVETEWGEYYGPHDGFCLLTLLSSQ